MADITVISTILTSLKTATEIAQLLKTSDISLEKAETKMKLAELLNALADAKIEMAGVSEILIAKEKSIKDLEEALDIKGKKKYEAPYYWLIEGENKDGPYCQQCYDNDGKLIRLQSRGRGMWHCRTCNNHFYDKDYVPSRPKVRTKFDPFNY